MQGTGGLRPCSPQAAHRGPVQSALNFLQAHELAPGMPQAALAAWLLPAQASRPADDEPVGSHLRAALAI